MECQMFSERLRLVATMGLSLSSIVSGSDYIIGISLTVSSFCFHSGLEFGGNTGISAVR